MMILDIRDLLDATIARVRSEVPKVYSKELVELLFYQPYCKIAFLVQAGIAKRQTAAFYLRSLEDAGILTSEIIGRERIFLNLSLLELLKRGNV